MTEIGSEWNVEFNPVRNEMRYRPIRLGLRERVPGMFCYERGIGEWTYGKPPTREEMAERRRVYAQLDQSIRRVVREWRFWDLHKKTGDTISGAPA